MYVIGVAVCNFSLITFTPNGEFHTDKSNYIHGFAVIKDFMKENLLLKYSEKLAVDIEVLCQSLRDIGGISNTIFQIRKSSSSVFANVSEAQYPQSLLDMLAKLKIARKECMETESWLKLLFATNTISEETFKTNRNLCGRIRKIITSSCITIENKLNNT